MRTSKSSSIREICGLVSGPRMRNMWENPNWGEGFSVRDAELLCSNWESVVPWTVPCFSTPLAREALVCASQLFSESFSSLGEYGEQKKHKFPFSPDRFAENLRIVKWKDEEGVTQCQSRESFLWRGFIMLQHTRKCHRENIQMLVNRSGG